MPYIEHLDPNSPRNAAKWALWEAMEVELGREPTQAELEDRIEELDWEQRYGKP